MIEKNINDSKIKKRITISIVVWMLFNALYLSADYFDLFSLVGINTNQINLDVISIVVGNSIVVLLYMITYFSLDSRNIKKRKNQRAIAELLLCSTYEKTKELVDLFSKADVTETAAKKCDFDKLEFEDLVLQKYFELPFDHNDMICKFAETGIIDGEEFKQYLEIRAMYRSHIRIKITFYDRPEMQTFKKDKLLDYLNENINKYKKED